MSPHGVDSQSPCLQGPSTALLISGVRKQHRAYAEAGAEGPGESPAVLATLRRGGTSGRTAAARVAGDHCNKHGRERLERCWRPLPVGDRSSPPDFGVRRRLALAARVKLIKIKFDTAVRNLRNSWTNPPYMAYAEGVHRRLCDLLK